MVRNNKKAKTHAHGPKHTQNKQKQNREPARSDSGAILADTLLMLAEKSYVAVKDADALLMLAEKSYVAAKDTQRQPPPCNAHFTCFTSHTDTLLIESRTQLAIHTDTRLISSNATHARKETHI